MGKRGREGPSTLWELDFIIREKLNRASVKKGVKRKNIEGKNEKVGGIGGKKHPFKKPISH